jgi:hypothetical protein
MFFSGFSGMDGGIENKICMLSEIVKL